MEYIFMIIIGLFTIIHTIIKPSYFWEHKKALGIRQRWGDRATTIIYLVLGGLLLTIGALIGVLTALDINEFLGMPVR
jgi:hypothetical protein